MLRHLYPKVNAEVNAAARVRAHLVASWDGDPAALEPTVSPAGRANTAALTRCLAMPLRVCDRAPAAWVYHLVLRNAPEDRLLSDDEWADVCTAAMDRTGIAREGDPAGCRWVAVRTDVDQAHVVATLAREDGREPNLWNSHWRLRDVAHDSERRYMLRSTETKRTGR